MSKYFDKKNISNISEIGQKIIKPNIDEETKNNIFSNIISGNYNKLFEIITPDIYLTFNDSDNNSVTHILLKVNDKLISENNKIKVLEFFLKHGAPLNTYNKEKLTPLHIAINNSYEKVVDFLLDHGANPNAETVNKLLPIHLALRARYEVCKDVIIPQNIGEIDIKDKNELKIILNNSIKDNFDKKYFDYFTQIFDDYLESINKAELWKEECDEITTELIKIQSGNSNIEEIKELINQKIEEKIQLRSKRMDYLDKIEIDKIIEDIKKEDYINAIIDNMKQNITEKETKTKELYNKKYDDLKSLFKDLETLYEKTLMKLKYQLILNSIAYNGDKVRIMYMKNNTVYIINGIVDASKKIIKFADKFNVIFDITSYKDISPYMCPFLLTYKLNKNTDRDNFYNTVINPVSTKGSPIQYYSDEFKNQINKLKSDLNTLQKINEEFKSKIICLDYFNIQNISSYKFILLNYHKICEIYKIITDILGYNKVDISIKTNDLNDDLFLNKSIIPNGLSKNIAGKEVSLNMIDNGKDIGPLLFEVNNMLKITTNLKTKKDEFEKFVRNINLNKDAMIFDLKYKNFDELNDLRDEYNDITNIKYLLKFIYKINNFSDPIKLDLTKYFTDKINNEDIQKNYLEYFDIPTNEIPYDYDSIKGKIVPLEDIIKSGTEFNKEHVKFNKDFSDDSKFYIMRNEEINEINNLFGTRNINNDIGKNYIKRAIDPMPRILYMDHLPINFLRNLIYKDALELIIDDTDPEKSKIKGIDILLNKYNAANIDLSLFLKETIKQTTEDLITELLKYYKLHYSKKLLNNCFVKNSKINVNFIKDSFFNIDVKKLIGIDYKKGSDFFINEKAKLKDRHYNYNYNSNDEGKLCYKNNEIIIKKLLKLPTVNYFIKDNYGNNLLHYIVELENFELIRHICKNPKIIGMKFIKNNANMIPIEIICQKIELNNKNFYIIKKGTNDKELLYSKMYSDELMIKLKNNNELYSIIPNKISNIFNDLYNLFNLENININIFDKIKIDNYDSLFNHSNKKWKLFTNKNKDNIPSYELYKFIQEKYNIDNKSIQNNQFIKRYWNTIIHCLTLHFSNVFFHIIKKYLLESNILISNISGKTSKIGITETEINNFKNRIFNYDPTFQDMNLAQSIVINLYQIDYNDTTKNIKSMGSLKDILKYYISPKLFKSGSVLGSLDNIIIDSKKEDFNLYMEKIYDYMNIFFDLINKKITLFLTNYIKFLELQYNLSEIKKIVS
jgi:hypothetical protein